MAESRLSTADIIKKDEKRILADWLGELRALVTDSRIDAKEVEAQASEFLRLVTAAAQ